MEERGVGVEHATINRWVIQYCPQLEEEFHRRKRPAWVSWRMDETDLKVKGQWVSIYRAVDKDGKPIDFVLTKQRDNKGARRFLNQAIGRHGVPAKITIDSSDANASAIKSDNEAQRTSIEIRQINYLNNLVEQTHQGVKRVTRPMLEFQSFEAAQPTLTGIELVGIIRKGQMEGDEFEGLTAAEPFSTLAS